MKFISWNVNGTRACLKKGFEEYFQEANADIFCIQETKCCQGGTGGVDAAGIPSVLELGHKEKATQGRQYLEGDLCR